MKPLTSLLNIGAQSAHWLALVGILEVADLERIGVVAAYCRVKRAFPNRVTLNLLYALQGGLLNVILTELPSELKANLRAQMKEQMAQPAGNHASRTR